MLRLGSVLFIGMVLSFVDSDYCICYLVYPSTVLREQYRVLLKWLCDREKYGADRDFWKEAKDLHTYLYALEGDCMRMFGGEYSNSISETFPSALSQWQDECYISSSFSTLTSFLSYVGSIRTSWASCRRRFDKNNFQTSFSVAKACKLLLNHHYRGGIFADKLFILQ